MVGYAGGFRCILEHWDRGQWRELTEARSLEDALAQARPMLLHSPQSQLRIAMQEGNKRKVYAVRPPARLVSPETGNLAYEAYIKRLTDRLLVVAAVGLAAMIAGMVAIELFGRLGFRFGTLL